MSPAIAPNRAIPSTSVPARTFVRDTAQDAGISMVFASFERSCDDATPAGTVSSDSRVALTRLVKGGFMTSLPLHPAVVHVPLGLAFVMPALALGFTWAVWAGRVRPRAWFALVALQALLLGAGLVAMTTGQREEDRVEAVVPESAIHQHEAAATRFLWVTGATLVLIGLVPVLRRPAVIRTLTVASVAGTFVLAAMAIRV